MLVILEGCDGVGKTTLAKALASILDAQVIHCNRTTPNNFNFFTDIIEAAKHKNIIADRFMYGQFVYQTPDQRELSTISLQSLEMQLLVNGAKVIYVHASTDVIEERLAQRGETTSLPVGEICQKFEQIFKTSMLPIMFWCTDSDAKRPKQPNSNPFKF